VNERSDPDPGVPETAVGAEADTGTDADRDAAGEDDRSADADGVDPVEVFPGGDLDLRAGADPCYKCSTCDSNCPVAEVDDGFPGPKFQGPEQWRLKRKTDRDVDPSIMDCSNCMRCDEACPADVPLSQMHNEARAEYVAEQTGRLSRTYWRNRLLANYRTVARLASSVPRLSNLLLGSSVVGAVAERLLGVTSERTFHEFAGETFREWYRARGGQVVSAKRARAARDDDAGASPGRGDDTGASPGRGSEKRVAYFHGCYANYNTPEVAKALVRVFERFGYEVAVPEQGCSGTPMFANGMLPDARRHAETNVASLSDLVEAGYDVVCSCTSCSLSLRQEYPELFDVDGTGEVAANTYEAVEYLRIHEDLREAVAGTSLDGPDLAYHAPCHARNQGLARQAVELFRELDGVRVEDVGDSCSGISGTYGWKAEKYDYSMAIGEEMFEEMDAAAGETGLTECPTCAMQMEHGTGYEVRHPLEILEAALVDG
jgi:glycerol-3-phosphate dehydrogenase subunit C